MSFRMIEMTAKTGCEEPASSLLEKHPVIASWCDYIKDETAQIKTLVHSADVESLMDDLETRFSHLEGFRLVVYPVEAIIPRPEKDMAQEGKQPEKSALRISREELYDDVSSNSELTKNFAALVILSAVVAAIGLLKDNVAVIIGAMVIAPLLGPCVGLALSTTMADTELGKRATKSILAGVALAFFFSFFVGYLLITGEPGPEILARTRVSLSDIALATASGAAGALAFTAGLSSALIGVMVAVALLPPVVTFGLMAGAGNHRLAAGAAMVFLVNFICINLSGVLTFVIKRIRPRDWWEAQKAKAQARKAIVIWTAYLAALALLILLVQHWAKW